MPIGDYDYVDPLPDDTDNETRDQIVNQAQQMTRQAVNATVSLLAPDQPLPFPDAGFPSHHTPPPQNDTPGDGSSGMSGGEDFHDPDGGTAPVLIDVAPALPPDLAQFFNDYLDDPVDPITGHTNDPLGISVMRAWQFERPLLQTFLDAGRHAGRSVAEVINSLFGHQVDTKQYDKQLKAMDHLLTCQSQSCVVNSSSYLHMLNTLPPTQSTLLQQETPTAEEMVAILETYGVSFVEAGEDATTDTWIAENATLIQNTYNAVQDMTLAFVHGLHIDGNLDLPELPAYVQPNLQSIIEELATTPENWATLFAENSQLAGLFVDIMGPTSIEWQPKETRAYSGETARLNYGIGINFTRVTNDPDYIPSTLNIVHEFGHVMDIRLGYYLRNRMSQEPLTVDNQVLWNYVLGTAHSRNRILGFSLDETFQLQHAEVIRDAEGNIIDNSAISPQEDWADHFLAWVYHRFSDDDYGRMRQSIVDEWLADAIAIAYGASHPERVSVHLRDTVVIGTP